MLNLQFVFLLSNNKTLLDLISLKVKYSKGIYTFNGFLSQARHGTRAPTKKRIRELNNLESQLEMLIREAVENGLSLHKLPSWLKLWKSPWRGKVKGGELIPKGEEELYDLGIRTRKMFPDLFSDDYHPEVYTIKATQVISCFGTVFVVYLQF